MAIPDVSRVSHRVKKGVNISNLTPGRRGGGSVNPGKQ